MLSPEEILHAALIRDPTDDLAWLALADWREENNQSARAELLRLTRQARLLDWQAAERPALENRIIELTVAGVESAHPVFVHPLGMRFRLLPPGRFLMGAAEGEKTTGVKERPRHQVTLTRAVWLAETPVTQKQYESLIGTNPSYYSAHGPGKDEIPSPDTGDFPVEWVDWVMAVEMAQRLTQQDPQTPWGTAEYRLPTEAEWEYACRGGALCMTRYHFGNILDNVNTQAHFDGTPHGSRGKTPSPRRTGPVRRYPPNAFGLYDMHGNVLEWCQDWYGENYYARKKHVDPVGPTRGHYRILRGGSWYNEGKDCRSAFRGINAPTITTQTIGFRLAMVITPP